MIFFPSAFSFVTHAEVLWINKGTFRAADAMVIQEWGRLRSLLPGPRQVRRLPAHPETEDNGKVPSALHVFLDLRTLYRWDTDKKQWRAASFKGARYIVVGRFKAAELSILKLYF